MSFTSSIYQSKLDGVSGKLNNAPDQFINVSSSCTHSINCVKSLLVKYSNLIMLVQVGLQDITKHANYDKEKRSY